MLLPTCYMHLPVDFHSQAYMNLQSNLLDSGGLQKLFSLTSTQLLKFPSSIVKKILSLWVKTHTVLIANIVNMSIYYVKMSRTLSSGSDGNLFLPLGTVHSIKCGVLLLQTGLVKKNYPFTVQY